MSEVATIFGIATVIIFIGFIGTMLFERTRFPDVLVLIALEIVLGPLTGILNSAELQGITSLFGALALTLILFDDGLEIAYWEQRVEKAFE